MFHVRFRWRGPLDQVARQGVCCCGLVSVQFSQNVVSTWHHSVSSDVRCSLACSAGSLWPESLRRRAQRPPRAPRSGIPSPAAPLAGFTRRVTSAPHRHRNRSASVCCWACATRPVPPPPCRRSPTPPARATASGCPTRRSTSATPRLRPPSPRSRTGSAGKASRSRRRCRAGCMSRPAAPSPRCRRRSGASCTTIRTSARRCGPIPANCPCRPARPPRSAARSAGCSASTRVPP